MNDYDRFLVSKSIAAQPVGFDVKLSDLHTKMFDWHRPLCRWGLKRGRGAFFLDCGLGKGFLSLEWAKQIRNHTNGDTIIFAPLAVAHQLKKEANKFGFEDVTVCRKQSDVRPGTNITNYEMLDHFDPDKFAAVALDESSILKNLDGKLRTKIIHSFRDTKFKSCYTATPSPNDFMELGSHAEFLGVMSQSEMLSTFFVHDGGETSKWRLKGHAEDAFWKWVCSWAVALRKPSDIGFSDEGFELPPLEMNEHLVETEAVMDGFLFQMEARTLDERRGARRSSLSDRVKFTADMVNQSKEQWVIWCDLNVESEQLTKAINGAVEIRGSDSDNKKVEAVQKFESGEIQKLVTKPSMFGWGLNFQFCRNTAFVGLSDSYEQFYQALRRFYRFGQKRTVKAHVITSKLEGAILRNIKRKQHDADEMMVQMISHMKETMQSEIVNCHRQTIEYAPKQAMQMPAFL